MAMSGHGHVLPNDDGKVAACGGPTICRDCRRELNTCAARVAVITEKQKLDNPALDEALARQQRPPDEFMHMLYDQGIVSGPVWRKNFDPDVLFCNAETQEEASALFRAWAVQQRLEHEERLILLAGAEERLSI